MLCMYCGKPIHQSADGRGNKSLIGHWVHANEPDGGERWGCGGAYITVADCALHPNPKDGPHTFLADSSKVVPITSSSQFATNTVNFSREIKYVELPIGRRFRTE